jgi:Transcriptional regulator DsbA
MTVVNTNIAKIPTDPKERKKVMDALVEISHSMTRIEAERDLIKSVLERLEDELEIPKKATRKLAKIYHKQNYTEVQAEQSELETLYETIVVNAGQNQ